MKSSLNLKNTTATYVTYICSCMYKLQFFSFVPFSNILTVFFFSSITFCNTLLQHIVTTEHIGLSCIFKLLNDRNLVKWHYLNDKHTFTIIFYLLRALSTLYHTQGIEQWNSTPPLPWCQSDENRNEKTSKSGN